MYEISPDELSGVRNAVDETSGRRVTVLPDGDTRLFHRRAFKLGGEGGHQEVNWLVAELDGVRAYIDGGDVVLTRRELYP